MIAPQQKSTKPAAKKHSVGYMAIAVGIGITIVVGLVAFLTMHPTAKRPHIQESKRQTKIEKERETHQAPTNQKATTEPSIETKDPSKMYEDGVEVVRYIASTNSAGAVIEKLTLADGRKISKVHPPKPVFENPADQVIALAVSVKPGESMPPLPNLTGIDEDFAKSLLAPIKINDDDPDNIKELKAKVIEAKAYLVDDIKNGGSVLDALLTHQKEMERIADSRLMAIQEMQRLQTEGDAEMAREFAIQVNESFKARGIPEIPVPAAK